MKLFPLAAAALALAGTAPAVADAQQYGDYGYQQREGDHADRNAPDRGAYREDQRGYDQRSYGDARYGYSGRGYARDYGRGGYPVQTGYAGYAGYGQTGYAQAYNADNYPRSYRPRQCSDGSAGTIIGAIAGGLFGNVVAGRGNHTVGTVIGGAAGALAGHAIDKSNNPGFCR